MLFGAYGADAKLVLGQPTMIILGIETSCDETAASVVEAKKNTIFPLSNVVSSQIKLHSKWGGVVPNLAAREHLKNILPVIETSLKEACVKFMDLDLIAVTNGSGLIPALLVGTTAAKTLSYVWQKPLLGIHHIEGHIYANFINEIRANSKFQITNKISAKGGPASGWQKFKIQNQKINFPILCLVVSGGHTQLVLMKNHLDYKIVGQTLDDAAGEAFDKVARILGLGYPGGPAIAEAADYRGMNAEKCGRIQRKSASSLRKSALGLPRPMINSNNLNFSFSGLKTAVLYTVKKNPEILKNKSLVARLCAEFQQAVIDVLVSKTLKATEKYKPKTVMLAGGVSANIELRNQLCNNLRKCYPKINYVLPEMKYSIDNATMIAAAGFFRWQKMNVSQRKNALKNWRALKTDANLKLT